MIIDKYRKFRYWLKLNINFIINLINLIFIKISLFLKNRPIVIINLHEHLGDIVACEPIARYIKKRSPNAFIIWLVHRHYRELLEYNPYIDLILEMHCLSEGILLSKISIYDELIDLHFSDRFCGLCIYPIKKSDKTRVNLKNFYDHGSILDAMTFAVGIPKLNIAPNIYIPAKVIVKVEKLSLPKDFIVVHTKSSNIAKDWSQEKWIFLIKKLANKGINIIEVGIDQTIACEAGVISLSGKLSILETAEVISRATLFLGIDSGPAHLANALSKEAILLMGEFAGWPDYNPFGPPFRKSNLCTIIRSTKVEDIHIEDVEKKVLGRYFQIIGQNKNETISIN